MHISDLSRETFVQYFGGLYEQSTWVVERVYSAGLDTTHDNSAALFKKFDQMFYEASDEEQLALLKSYPDLVGKSASSGVISREWVAEQAEAGLNRCIPEQIERFNELNRLYWSKFDFPFVVSLRGRSPEDILKLFGERLHNQRGTELKIALFEVQKIARLRLEALVQQRMPVIRPLAMPIDSMLHPTDMDGAYQGRTESKKPARLVMTAAQMRDPNYSPGVARSLSLGIQHVLAMFVGNITPAILVAGVVGFGFGSENPGNMAYMIQMSLFFAGISTLIQTIGIGPVGARLPIVQGAGFVYLPIMIPIAVQYGMPTLMGSIVIAGVFHFFLGMMIGRIRRWIPPLITGLVVLMVGVELIRIGVLYAAGGEQLKGTPEFGGMDQWSLALIVIVVTLIIKFFARGILSEAAVLLGLLAGYVFAWWQGIVSLTGVQNAVWFAMPNPLHFGFEFNFAAVLGMCLMAFVSVIATLGNISVLTQVGADREATNKELIGGTTASGLGNAVGGVFGALPGTSFSQNVGLVFLTGLMSRHAVTFGALLLILCGLMPVLGAAIQTMPVAVLGGALLVMLGMVLAAGVNMLAAVDWNKRNMLIFGVAMSVGLGLQFEPDALQNLPQTATVLMSSGLLPAVFIAVTLNSVLPQSFSDDPSKQVSEA